MSQEISPEIAKRIELLQEKFKNSGQDMLSYLDGLLYDQYITYWDYIRLDTLLSLQVPATHFPDEMIFIGYHQITELYFKLIIHEQKQIIENEQLTGAFFAEKAKRINRYFTVLINSFDVMVRGMEREQFLKFRMSLLPASGFQSAQFRMIEFYSTDLINLVHPTVRDNYRNKDNVQDYAFAKAESVTNQELYENIYWKKGGIDMHTGEKTLTLKQFEKRYTPRFLRIAGEVQNTNLNQQFLQLPDEEKTEDLIEALRMLDQNANINWLLMHMGAAHRYLRKEGQAVQATGGTNWKQFLPPSFQKISFFPSLWTQQEHDEWGKQWVTHALNTK
ncbi:tryptophan 2,3-dioxygenase [Nonlabens sp. MIC269]|uniref:tryptophan 2,3-dioxygenase family protein n=1 Tax=Nonlabens TaxID=363408 RepID=UPI00071EB037|nr:MULTISPECIES: tryptophan 2,3-dioxygenase family protein [Nonlabens]ALM20794.1 tryptophan 2,3-dioxygenase [Nonlabens sp. MIC269]ARN72487.1 tryptophan 2,3-dioxygenase [Nonlabens tegetincola]PQJ19012.1 tryptophan 2,3-dioxygenase [Nonlabens tegetincola]